MEDSSRQSEIERTETDAFGWEPDGEAVGTAPATDASDAFVASAWNTLRQHLRDPQGCVAHAWSAADGSWGSILDLNELYVLVMAWRDQDPALARGFVENAFACVRGDGAVPRWFRPDGFVPDWRAPWPLLAQSALAAVEHTPAPDFQRAIVPRLEAYLHWAIGHFDPSGAGIPTWQHASESFLPDTWDRALATADLPVMLTGECEALQQLAEPAPGLLRDPAWLSDRLTRLRSTLATYFRDPDTGLYRDRYRAEGVRSDRITLSCFSPLLLRGLPPEERRPLARALLAGHYPTSEHGFPLWERWPNDALDPPVTAIHQAIMLNALEPEKATPQVARLRSAIRDSLSEALDRTASLPSNLAARPDASAPEAAMPGESSAMGAALALLVAWRPPTAPSPPPPILRWMDRRRLVVVSAIVSLAVVALVTVFALVHGRRTLPWSSLETIAALARESYNRRDYEDAIDLYEEFLHRSSGTNGVVHVLLGNALFRAGRFAEAEPHYRAALNESESSLHALYNLGQTLARLDRFDESAVCFDEFVKAYRTDYPDQAELAAIALEMLRTGLVFPRTTSGP